MKVIQINGVDGILSTGVTTTQLSKYLTSKGINNIRVCRKDHCTKESVTIGNIIGYRIHALLSRLTGLQGFFSLFSTLKLLFLMSRYQPDIVHLRNLHENFINIPLLLWYLGKKDIATVITLHDCFFFTGGCTYYTVNDCDMWATNRCRHCNYKKTIGSYWFGCNTSLGYDIKYYLFHKINKLGVIGVSNWVANEAKKSPIFHNATVIKPIYNWIDLELFKEQPLYKTEALKKEFGITGKFVILGVCSQWAKNKGLYDHLKIAQKLGNDSVIILIGNMPSDVNLPDNIISIPRTYKIEDLIKFYSMADVFVHLSVEETFGKVTAEALSCGTPVIVYNATASPELVANGCGYVISTIGDISAVVEAINTIKNHGKAFYSKTCRNKAITSFNDKTNCEEYIRLYNTLLNN